MAEFKDRIYRVGHFRIRLSDVLDKLAVQRGDTLTLRSTSPDCESGLIQYIWRLARFYSGSLSRLPLSADRHLQNWVDEQFGEGFADVIEPDKKGERILQYADRICSDVMDVLNLDKMAAFRRWMRLVTFGKSWKE